MNNNGHEKKQLIAEVFDRAAAGYGHLRYVQPFGRRLVELAQIPVGANVLDVASGRGAVLFPAAERVGPQGQVVGIDLSPAMVLETSLETRRRGLTNVIIYPMDAETLKFPRASFDYVLCGFGLFFFPEPQRALFEFQRVLKPGGRLAVTIWGAEDERWRWYDELLATYGAVVKLKNQIFNQREGLELSLRQAGFSDIRLVTEEADIPFADEAEWWAGQWSISGRAGLERLEPAALDQMKAEVFEKIQALKQPDGLPCRYQTHFGLATKR
ncbi:MAG TPA: methyltransferase domain-containing protein [Anaerolineae bacterium]|nr:methyltransferase domain-containing protein [Anaerolineae bacterium]